MYLIRRSNYCIALLIICSHIAKAQTSRDSLNQYIAALQKTPGDSALQAKIIILAQTITPAPSIPDDAERYLVRGKAAIEMVKGSNDYRDAIEEFKKATLAAPWLGMVYFNLAVAQELAADYNNAIRNYKFYLLAEPNASDSKEVKTKIYELEYKLEKTTALRQRQQEFRDGYNKIKSLVANRIYRHLVCSYYMPGCESCESGGCNLDEVQGPNWRGWRNGTYASFTFPNDTTIQLIDLSGKVLYEAVPDRDWLQGAATYKDYGMTLDGNAIEMVQFNWYCGPKTGNSKPIFAQLLVRGALVRFSCDCPVGGTGSAIRYHYDDYRDYKEFPVK